MKKILFILVMMLSLTSFSQNFNQLKRLNTVRDSDKIWIDSLNHLIERISVYTFRNYLLRFSYPLSVTYTRDANDSTILQYANVGGHTYFNLVSRFGTGLSSGIESGIISSNDPWVLVYSNGQNHNTYIKPDTNGIKIVVTTAFGYGVTEQYDSSEITLTPTNSAKWYGYRYGSKSPTIKDSLSLLDSAQVGKMVTSGSDVSTLQYTTPTTGNTVTSDGSSYLVANPSGSLVALTIKFPPAPKNGQTLTVSISQIITTLTLNGNGNTVDGTIVTSGTNSYGGWVFSSTASTWFKKS